MKTNILKNIFFGLMAAVFMVPIASCTKDDEHTAAPQINSVWLNMVSKPIEEVTCAYPKQTICLHGSGFGTLSRVIVNGDDINLNTLFVYETDNNITFQLPETISTEGDYIRVVTGYGMCDYNFIVRPLDEQPVINDFIPSLIPGTVTRIYGSNLSGAYEITLPLTFDNSVTVDCEYGCEYEQVADENSETGYVNGNVTQEWVSFVVPDGVDFATGQYMIAMNKHDETRNIDYNEKAYSSTITYTNY